MKVLWDERAWGEYLEWQVQDKKTLKRINALIKDIQRNCCEGIGMICSPYGRQWKYPKTII